MKPIIIKNKVAMVPYTSLDINNRINAKTGWDIAVAMEGKQYYDYKCYTRLAVLNRVGVNLKLVGNIYKCYR
jgi:hypothetical protein